MAQAVLVLDSIVAAAPIVDIAHEFPRSKAIIRALAVSPRRHLIDTPLPSLLA